MVIVLFHTVSNHKPLEFLIYSYFCFAQNIVNKSVHNEGCKTIFSFTIHNFCGSVQSEQFKL